MKKVIIVFSCLVIIVSCFANKTKQNNTSPKLLYGLWSYENVPWLRITSDSIYFVDEEDFPSIKYSVNKDTIILYFDGIIVKNKYYIVQDTLFTETEEGTGKYIRVNDKRD